ncbi:MAG: hypothetical protein IKU38_04720 [Clostridia bacterium]|nr:hypothetical protein [Clostridia bacterium]
MKKFLVLAACLSLVASLAVGGSIAYLQDTDSAVNVMTLGNVKIEQIEQERDEDGGLVDFTQAKPLYPAVFEGSSIDWAPESEWVKPGDQAWKVVEDNSNVVDKFVTVKNIGKSDAYVRTIIAYEGDATYGPNGEYIHIVHNSTNVDPAIIVEDAGYVEVDGVTYTVFVYTYPQPLAPKDITIPSLKQVYMNKAADNDVVAEYGDTYDILVLSQAVQIEGFGDPETALDTAFGDVTADTLEEWLDDVKEENDVVLVTTYADLDAALSKGSKIVMLNDIEAEYTINMPAGVSSVLDMNGKTLTVKEGCTADPMINMDLDATLVITGNGTVDYENDYFPNFILPGHLTIENGNFIRDRIENPESMNVNNIFPLIPGIKNSTTIINGGYFDGGYYVEGDCDNNCKRNTMNITNNQTFLVYGGTFVGQNPAYGDEGRADLCPECSGRTAQGFFLEGQTQTSTEIPAGYTITESTHADGRPMYTVEYTKP